MPSVVLAPPVDDVDRSEIATPKRQPSQDHPWRRAASIGVATWLGAIATYVLITMLSFMMRDEPGPALSQLYKVWDHWDTGYYMRISRVGYTADRLDTHAYFPLYPIVLRGLDAVLPGPTLVATLALANICCLGALIVLHRFIAREFGSTVADRTLLFLMAFPTAFFLSAGYNGSFFLLLSVSALYCMRSGSFWAAGALGALASATRLTGALLVLPFLLEYGRQHGWSLQWRRRGSLPIPRLRLGTVRPSAAGVLLIPVGVGAFAFFCWVSFGDALSFLHAQKGWGRHTAWPWETLSEALGKAISQPGLLYQAAVHNYLDVVFALLGIAGLVLCVVGRWRFRPDQMFMVVYSGAVLLMILFGPNGGMFPMGGVPRYVLELVPAFILLGRLGQSRIFERVYLLPAIGTQTVFLLTFLDNVWVA